MTDHSRAGIFGWLMLSLAGSVCAQRADAEQPPPSGQTETAEIEAAEFWAFQKLARPNVPVVGHNQRVRSPVDAFVLAKLKDQGLSFSPDADPLTLVRRAYLDLIGLPPSPDEVERFRRESIDNPQSAFGNLLDRLLASPHFGERWGQHWLDTAGFVPEREFRWRYRDYVVRVFNSDKPYDRFLIEQLAGDELVDWRAAKTLTPQMAELLVATGFLRTANDLTGNAMTDIPSYRYALLFDTLEIFGSSVMGLTLQCARCHTHKFDPIPQRDYYRLMALFTPAYNPDQWIRAPQRMLRGDIAGLADVGPAPKTRLLLGGDFRNAGPEVKPGFLGYFCDSESDALAPAVHADAKGETSGRRLALAQWLTKPNTRVGGLVNRVLVNRIWHHLFGQGIVATPGNLGHSGAPPTHPELIDFLAREFVRGGRRVKPLLKRLMMSTVYRQAPEDNRPRWRMRVRRLDSEVIRDAILTASGKLDRTVGGASVPLKSLVGGLTVVDTDNLTTPSDQWRRSIYLKSRRVDGGTSPQPSVSLLNVFDQPILTTNCTKRRSSTVVLQSLTMLNDEFVLRQAGYFAERVAEEAGPTMRDRIDRAFQIALARVPSVEEADWSERFLNEQANAYRASLTSPKAADTKALATLCHALFNTNNFLYVE